MQTGVQADEESRSEGLWEHPNLNLINLNNLQKATKGGHHGLKRKFIAARTWMEKALGGVTALKGSQTSNEVKI